MAAQALIFAALADLAKKLPEKALDLLLDPAFNEALSPSAGLIVTPLTFSSVEQEGRWKLDDWGYNDPQVLSNRILAAAQTSPVPNPADAPVNFYPAVGGGAAATKRGYGRLLTIDIPKPSSVTTVALSALLGPPVAQLLNSTILQKGHAEISADWQHDGLEIWGGFAGLTSAQGFGSVFGHRASVQLTGTVYGNYLPGAYMIAMTGNVNPVGTTYVEFRCAVIIQAGKDIQPLYGQQWDRDGNGKDLTRFNSKTGFGLDLS